MRIGSSIFSMQMHPHEYGGCKANRQPADRRLIAHDRPINRLNPGQIQFSSGQIGTYFTSAPSESDVARRDPQLATLKVNIAGTRSVHLSVSAARILIHRIKWQKRVASGGPWLQPVRINSLARQIQRWPIASIKKNI